MLRFPAWNAFHARRRNIRLHRSEPSADFVVATGAQCSVRQFLQWSAEELGIALRFEAEGRDERGVAESVAGDSAPAVKPGDVLVRVDSRYFRPAEGETLLGDPTKAREQLGWVPETGTREMCAEMVAHGLDQARRHALLGRHGHEVAAGSQSLHRFGFGIGRMDECAGRRNAADWIDSFAMRIVTRYNLRSPP